MDRIGMTINGSSVAPATGGRSFATEAHHFREPRTSQGAGRLSNSTISATAVAGSASYDEQRHDGSVVRHRAAHEYTLLCGSTSPAALSVPRLSSLRMRCNRLAMTVSIYLRNVMTYRDDRPSRCLAPGSQDDQGQRKDSLAEPIPHMTPISRNSSVMRPGATRLI
jgi:hypothetical protein